MLSELKDGLQSLLKSRGFTAPDGRPLYAYKFERSEFDRIGEMLRRLGPLALGDRDGAALVVSHIAEWFRRERSGGHWDWIRPLRSIGLDYGPDSRVTYRDVESLVSVGLKVWRRPQPVGAERLLAIVREAGFPVASVREDPRISSWLKYAVLATESGFSVRDSVGAEAWRVSDRLAQALFEPAAELCEKVVELRASFPPGESRRDPVTYLDEHRPDWRNELPFDVESGDIRTMVEQIVRIRDERSTALNVVRYYVRAGEVWQARASLCLSGRVELRCLPSSVDDAVRDGRRVRILPRPPFCDEIVAVAAIETFEKEDTQQHELRALLSKFDAPLRLEDEARLVAHAGNTTLAEFIPPGGDAYLDPVIALQVEQINENGIPISFRVLGPSPVRTSRPILGLAVLEDQLSSITFSADFIDVGSCDDSGRRIVCFSGVATLRVAGAVWSWRTAAEGEVAAKPVLAGARVRNAHESAFLGVPKFWIERDGHLMSPRNHEVFWRPRGRGTWRPVQGGNPWGAVDLAVIDSSEVQVSISAVIVPPAFDVTWDRGNRELRITGLETSLVAARGAVNLDVRFENGVALVRLGPPTRTATIVVRLRWDAEAVLTFSDPSHDFHMIDCNDALVPPQSTFSVDGLKGFRVLATREAPLCMELRADDAPRLIITRPISGEVPLAAFATAIRQLLGSSDSLDARVSLTAFGGTKHIADIRWYAEDVDPFDAPRPNAFSVLANAYGLEVEGIALAHPSAGSIPLKAPASRSQMRSELARLLPSGPWIVHGRRRHGAKIRPRIVEAAARVSSGEKSVLEAAFVTDAPQAREAAFLQAYAQPEKLSLQDRRTILDLVMIARHHELPISSINAITFLDRSTKLAVILLASCESLDERAAMLDIQRDLPFLWCATTLGDWLGAFADRIGHARKRLDEVGLDSSIAYLNVVTALSEIVALRPELAGHARAVFLLNVSVEMARENKPVDGTAINFLKIDGAHGIRREIDRLIGRHDDGNPPPRDLLSLKSRESQKVHWAKYDPMFADIISVPFAIADHASDRNRLTDKELRRCRDVWLYDPEYFEAIMPICIGMMLRIAATTGEGKHD